MVKELVAHVREAFGWGEDVVASAGPRGALGQIWRLDVGPARYALKEIFAEPPSEALIEAELAFARRAAEVGVRLPASHPDREGRHLLAAPGETWLRLYDWIDLRPVELTAQATPRELVRARGWSGSHHRAGGLLDAPRGPAELLAGRRASLDPQAEQRHREWAEREIYEALRILPTPRQLADVLELTRTH